jgi:type II secretory pathway pseudopilin PulG
MSRRGITLTEILISILIFGIGVVSIMTLFPLGMIRVRDATRMTRSAFLVESAAADLATRNLLSKASFLNPVSAPWYNLSGYTARPYDPWVQDTPSYGGDPWKPPFGAYRGQGPPPAMGNTMGTVPGPGLPVAYDPLWRLTTPPPIPLGSQPAVGYFPGAPWEARFASGIGAVRPDPNPGAGASDPSAHGLQRITNFPYVNAFPYTNTTTVPSIFVSPEDVVLQSDTDSGKPIGSVSPIVPDLALAKNATTNLPTPQYDWKYTWMFTGQQADSTNGTVFVGDIVVFENRPFAVDTAGKSPFTSSNPQIVTSVVAGEPVVEAIFGYTNNVTVGVSKTASKVGYGSKANRAVLLRWAASMPDPEVKVGSWIADVTYERNASEDFARATRDPTDAADLIVTGGVGPAGAFYPYQRCYWYQVAKRTQAGPAANSFAGDASVGMREMTVWTSTPLRAFTLLSASSGAPYHVNAALVSPYVVNVFPRTIYTR